MFVCFTSPCQFAPGKSDGLCKYYKIMPKSMQMRLTPLDLYTAIRTQLHWTCTVHVQHIQYITTSRQAGKDCHIWKADSSLCCWCAACTCQCALLICSLWTLHWIHLMNICCWKVLQTKQQNAVDYLLIFFKTILTVVLWSDTLSAEQSCHTASDKWVLIHTATRDPGPHTHTDVICFLGRTVSKNVWIHHTK